MRCAVCGVENREGARFCDGCGALLEASPAVRETRRTVTVVFVDVVGSTALGDRFDPESLRRLIGEFFDLARPVVERHGGIVEKFIGDAVMAVFGLPTLHEDDALRAVRAAAELNAALTAHPTLAQEISIRTGINTGLVVAGDPSAGQRLVTGDAVNVAARLQQAARPGEVLLGRETWRLVRGAIVAEDVGTIEAKGKPGGVEAVRLVSVDPAGELAARHMGVRLVGRDRELGRLIRAFEDAVADRRCWLFTLLGPAGAGKSRLVAELVGRVDQRATILRGRCLPYGDGITYWPIAEIVRQVTGIDETDDAPSAGLKLAELLGEEPDAPQIRERLSTAIGLAAGTVDREGSAWAFRRLLEILARQRPVVVMVDDIHWAEPGLLDLLDHVARWSRGASILLTVVARPEFLDDRADWAGGLVNATTLLLEPLTDAETRELAGEVLGGVLDQRLADRVVALAEGNPLFVEQVVAMLRDEGRLEARGDGWVATGAPDTLEVPPTVQAVVAARLDRLPSAERTTAARASVVGRVFERAAVAELSPEPERAVVRELLRGLVRRELIGPDPDSFQPDETFRFRHILIRDAAYDSLPKQERAELHVRFADWLEETAGGRLAEYEEIVGYHLEQAHRLRRELGEPATGLTAVGSRAAHHLAAAGRRAIERSDSPAAVNLYERAFALAPEDPAIVRELPFLSLAYLSSPHPAPGVDAYRRAIALGRELGDRGLELGGRVLEIGSEDSSGDTPISQVREEVLGFLPELERTGEHWAAARALGIMSEIEQARGRPSRALEWAERSREVALRGGHAREAVRQLHPMVIALATGPLPVREALHRADEIMTLVGGNRGFHVECEVTRAVILAMAGEAQEARTVIEEAEAAAMEFGPVLDAIVASFASWANAILGDAPRAEEAARRAIRLHESAGVTSWATQQTVFLADILCDQARWTEAGDVLAYETRAGESLDVLTLDLRVRARLAATAGDHERAEELIARAHELLDPTELLAEQADLALDAARVARAAGRQELARERAAEAAELYGRKGHVSGSREVAAFMAGLS